jgi:adenylate cyclase
MYTDMIGYTALGQRHESLSLALLEEQRKIIRPVLMRHNGREIKTMGDAFLVEFPNALDAVRCAYDIQRATREFNISLPEQKRIHLRVGLHLGDVVESEGDISGDTVNVASRIEPLAEDGGVCLTRQVYESTHNKFEVPLISLGMKSLKNVIEPMEVFKMKMPWENALTAGIATNQSNRIAVLPFANMSPDPNDEYFADGMTEEVISTVSRLDQVEVISRTSVMQYKKYPKSSTEVSRELNVSTIIEGSVRKAGNRLRITAQMIDATKDRHLWAETYDRNMEDVFTVQSEVAERVAGALRARIHAPEHGESTGNIEAYTLYLRATQLMHESVKASCREAIALFENAISIDPMFSRAYSGLAQAWMLMGSWWNWADFTSSVKKAEVAARKALELVPDSAEAHAVMGSVHVAMDRSEEARFDLEKAIRINPNLAWANEALGVLYGSLGSFDKAVKYVQKAHYLDPLNPSPVRILTNILRAEGKVDEALEVVGSFKGHAGKNPVVYLQTALCYLQKKDFAKADEALNDGLKLNLDDHWLRVTRGMTYALMGRREEAVDELRGLLADEDESNRLDAQAWIRTSMGDLDEAFEALMKAAEFHSWWFLIKSDPLFEGLWKDPRFTEFCKKVGLPP